MVFLIRTASSVYTTFSDNDVPCVVAPSSTAPNKVLCTGDEHQLSSNLNWAMWSFSWWFWTATTTTTMPTMKPLMKYIVQGSYSGWLSKRILVALGIGCFAYELYIKDPGLRLTLRPTDSEQLFKTKKCKELCSPNSNSAKKCSFLSFNRKITDKQWKPTTINPRTGSEHPNRRGWLTAGVTHQAKEHMEEPKNNFCLSSMCESNAEENAEGRWNKANSRRTAQVFSMHCHRPALRVATSSCVVSRDLTISMLMMLSSWANILSF